MPQTLKAKCGEEQPKTMNKKDPGVQREEKEAAPQKPKPPERSGTVVQPFGFY